MQTGTTWHTPERISAFVDGVVFVAMTILILTVELPSTGERHGDAALLAALAEVLPNLFAYVASFVVIALYWMGYNSHFRRLERIDQTMLWMIILFLLLIGLVPFATSLTGEHQGLVATAIYSGTMIAIALVLIGMSAHARRRGLFESAEARAEWLPRIAPWIKIVTIFALSMIVAIFQPSHAGLTYLLIAVPDHAFNRLLGIRNRTGS